MCISRSNITHKENPEKKNSLDLIFKTKDKSKIKKTNTQEYTTIDKFKLELSKQE